MSVQGGGGLCPGEGVSVQRETPPPVNRMTDASKNITLPQTSFAGGNKKAFNRMCTDCGNGLYSWVGGLWGGGVGYRVYPEGALRYERSLKDVTSEKI